MANTAVLRARSLVGCQFRPQGREPEIGLDCIGLICAAFGLPTGVIPRDYRLRGGQIERLESEMGRFFRRIQEPAEGDVLVLRVSADQLHLAIATERGFIHADAGLRRVVETPGAPPWPLLSAYRRKA